MLSLISSVSFCVVFAIINTDVAHGEVVWDFGRDTRDSYVVGRDKGEIQLLHKVTRIPLNVPQCHEVTYVRVQVENSVSTPTVTYDEQALTVTISYTLLQVSYSSYDILVKGRLIHGCTNAVNRYPAGCFDKENRPIACGDYDRYDDEIYEGRRN